jgi:thiol:disulfide interchange protein DsbD
LNLIEYTNQASENFQNRNAIINSSLASVGAFSQHEKKDSSLDPVTREEQRILTHKHITETVKSLILVLFLLAAGAGASEAQILTPVRWSYAAKKISPKEAVIFLKADLDPGWHVYSQDVKEGGPVKTTIKFQPSPDYALKGSTIEPKPITKMEQVFSMEVSYFEKSVVFQQKITLKKGQTTVKGSVGYMTCNDEKCLPPTTEEFSVPLK